MAKEKKTVEAKEPKVEVADKVKDTNSKSNDKQVKTAKSSEKKSNPFMFIVLFVRQIIDELKKVTAPTKDELVEYSIVVLVFVLVIMLFITGVDFLIGKGIMAVFAN